jgi:hypothetical protein
MFDYMGTKLPVKFRSFSELYKINQIAGQLFIEHQIACMFGFWDEALHAMEMMYDLRMQNITNEEELLLPLYQSEIMEIPQGGAIKFFLREYELIKKKLNSIVRNNSNIVLNNSGNEVNLVKLFEDYHSVKDLLDHHDARDRVFLYKLLDENLNKEKRELILREINVRHDKLMRKLGCRYEYA